MSMPDPDNLTDTTVLRLVDTLNDMRNTMAKASLPLRDLHFESDAVQRKAAIEHADEWMEKVKPR